MSRDFQCECGNIIKTSEADCLSNVTCEKCGESFVVPWFLGDYEIVELIEESIIFRIYIAYKSDRQVKLYILRNDIVDPAGWADECEFEVRVLNSLESQKILKPNFCTSLVKDRVRYTIIEEDILPYSSIAEYGDEIQAGTEHNLLLNIVIDAVNTLAMAHSKNISLQSISLDNMLINKNSSLVFTNVFINRLTNKYLKNTGSDLFPLLDFNFVSPEWLTSKNSDLSSDVFSFGVFIFYVFTATYPYIGETDSDSLLLRIGQNSNGETVNFNAPKMSEFVAAGDVALTLEHPVSKMISQTEAKRPTIPALLEGISDVKIDMKAKQDLKRRKAMVATAATLNPQE